MADGLDFSFLNDAGSSGGYDFDPSQYSLGVAGGLSRGIGGFDPSISGVGDIMTQTQGPTGLSDLAGQIGSGIRQFTTPVGQIAKEVSPLLGIGTGIMGAVAQQRAAGQISDAAQQNQKARDAQLAATQQAREAASTAQPIANTLAQTGTTALQRAEAGQLDPAVEQAIENWKANALMQARDFLARSGQDTSTQRLVWENFINNKAQEMRASQLGALKQFGTGALGSAGNVTAQETAGLTGAAGGLGQSAQASAQEMASLQSLIAQANQTLARLNAGVAT